MQKKKILRNVAEFTRQKKWDRIQKPQEIFLSYFSKDFHCYDAALKSLIF